MQALAAPSAHEKIFPKFIGDMTGDEKFLIGNRLNLILTCSATEND